MNHIESQGFVNRTSQKPVFKSLVILFLVTQAYLPVFDIERFLFQFSENASYVYLN